MSIKTYSVDKLRNIGIVSHVDAGKTTLAEQMLYYSGKIRKVGRVDEGTSQLDWLSTEKQRGITILAATTTFSWKDYQINLIDTPGHVDFSSETQRSLWILDGVIVVVSGVEGVQAHTLTLWKAIQKLGIPAVFFINKIDQNGAKYETVFNEINDKLTPNALLLQYPLYTDYEFSDVFSIFDCDVPKEFQSILTQLRTRLIEKLADYDDKVLEYYIHEKDMNNTWLKTRLKEQILFRNVYPVIMGSALKNIGVKPLLDDIVNYFPPPEISEQSDLSAVVFKVQREPNMGRMVFVRVYSGELVNRQLIENTNQDISEKVSQIRKIHANSYEDIGKVTAGDIAALCGLKQTKIGDIIGDSESIPSIPDMPVPVFQVKAFPVSKNEYSTGLIEDTESIESSADYADYVSLAKALKELEDEEPRLRIYWNPEVQELSIQVMGLVQVEILQNILKERFELYAGFGKPSVVFKETPAKAGYGSVHYTSVPHWAVLKFLIEPAERGSGLEYKSIVRPGELKIRYQREVERRVPRALEQGLKGWEVVDLKVTLVEGEHHEQHTHPLDFIAGTMWAIEDGLKNCGTKLLEPILAFRISAPVEAGGRICNELLNRRAEFEETVFKENEFYLEGEVPALTVLELPVLLRQWTGGKAIMTTNFVRYELAPDEYNDEPANTQPKKEFVSFKSYM